MELLAALPCAPSWFAKQRANRPEGNTLNLSSEPQRKVTLAKKSWRAVSLQASIEIADKPPPTFAPLLKRRQQNRAICSFSKGWTKKRIIGLQGPARLIATFRMRTRIAFYQIPVGLMVYRAIDLNLGVVVRPLFPSNGVKPSTWSLVRMSSAGREAVTHRQAFWD